MKDFLKEEQKRQIAALGKEYRKWLILHGKKWGFTKLFGSNRRRSDIDVITKHWNSYKNWLPNVGRFPISHEDIILCADSRLRNYHDRGPIPRLLKSGTPDECAESNLLIRTYYKEFMIGGEVHKATGSICYIKDALGNWITNVDDIRTISGERWEHISYPKTLEVHYEVSDDEFILLQVEYKDQLVRYYYGGVLV